MKCKMFTGLGFLLWERVAVAALLSQVRLCVWVTKVFKCLHKRTRQLACLCDVLRVTPSLGAVDCRPCRAPSSPSRRSVCPGRSGLHRERCMRVGTVAGAVLALGSDPGVRPHTFLPTVMLPCHRLRFQQRPFPEAPKPKISSPTSVILR